MLLLLLLLSIFLNQAIHNIIQTTNIVVQNTHVRTKISLLSSKPPYIPLRVDPNNYYYLISIVLK